MTQDHSSVIWGPHLVGDEPEDGRTIDVVMSEIERDVMTEFLSRPPIFVVPSWVYRKIALIRDPAKIDINGEPWHECVALGDDVDDPEAVGGDGER